MRLLFYGDSNTWGYNPETRLRYEKRYTKQIQEAFLEDEIIEAGLCGRTLCQEDPCDVDRKGIRGIQMEIKTHLPLDLIVIVLGTNDCKRMYSTNKYSLEKGTRALLDTILVPSLYKDYPQPEVLVVYPPLMNEAYTNNPKTVANFGKEGFDMLMEARQLVNDTCQAYHVHYLDTKVVAGEYDGIHLSQEGHNALAKQLIKKIGELK